MSGYEIPIEFAQMTDKFVTVSDQILSQSYLRCFGGEIFSPGFFFVNMVESWNQQEAYMVKLRRRMDAMVNSKDYKKDLLTPSLLTLNPGLPVMVKHTIDGKTEWYRGRILRKVTDDRFIVELLDYGDQARINLHNIKYLPRDFLTEFPIQGIECRLLFKGQKSPNPWPNDARSMIQSLLLDKTLGVFFHERITYFAPEANVTRPCWLVSIHLMDGCTDSLCNPDACPGDPEVNEYHTREFVRTIQDFDISHHFIEFLSPQDE